MRNARDDKTRGRSEITVIFTSALVNEVAASAGETWICPYCQHAQVLDDQRFENSTHEFEIEGGKNQDASYYSAEAMCVRITLPGIDPELRSG
jgi:hypothetical protein